METQGREVISMIKREPRRVVEKLCVYGFEASLGNMISKKSKGRPGMEGKD
jgi:hypothetical protein